MHAISDPFDYIIVDTGYVKNLLHHELQTDFFKKFEDNNDVVPVLVCDGSISRAIINKSDAVCYYDYELVNPSKHSTDLLTIVNTKCIRYSGIVVFKVYNSIVNPIRIVDELKSVNYCKFGPLISIKLLQIDDGAKIFYMYYKCENIVLSDNTPATATKFIDLFSAVDDEDDEDEDDEEEEEED